jgi:predicted transcriptional regulator
MSPPRIVPIRDQILSLRDQDPDIPSIAIARKIGVSRQRISQLLKDLNLPIRTKKSHGQGVMKQRKPSHPVVAQS